MIRGIREREPNGRSVACRMGSEEVGRSSGSVDSVVRSSQAVADSDSCGDA